MQTQLDMEVFVKHTPLEVLNSHGIFSFLMSASWGTDHVDKMIHILTKRFDVAPLELRQQFLSKKKELVSRILQPNSQGSCQHQVISHPPSPRLSAI